MSASVERVVTAWAERGTPFTATGIRSMVWSEGDGEPVLCLHGVPSSAFLYRKVLPELAARGLRGIAFDLPGLGLAERPESFDYRWSSLSAWVVAAVDALELDRVHLVVHDIGGPIGFDAARRVPERIRSLTVLNTMVRVASFRRPWSMQPFAMRGLGQAYLATLQPWAFERLMRVQGATGHTRRRSPGVSMTRRSRCARAAREVREALGVDVIQRLHGRHFVQEDAPGDIAAVVATVAAG